MEITLLDDLLRYSLFVHRSEKPFLPDSNRINTESYNFASKEDVQAAMEKLVKDGYILKPEGIGDSFTRRYIAIYKITFDGILFISNGGYARAMEQNRQKEIYFRKIDAVQFSLKNLTIWIAFGTVVAAIYYGIEIYKYLKEIFS